MPMTGGSRGSFEAPELPDRRAAVALGARVRIHRARGAGVVAVAGRPRGLRGVVRHGPQRAGPARRAGVRPPAAHLGRPRADRPRLPPLRRLDDDRAGGSRASTLEVEARLRAAGTSRDVLVARVARAVAGVASCRLRAGDRRDAARCERIEFVPLEGGRIFVVVVVDRRRGRAQGDHLRRAGHARRAGRSRRTT